MQVINTLAYCSKVYIKCEKFYENELVLQVEKSFKLDRIKKKFDLLIFVKFVK